MCQMGPSSHSHLTRKRSFENISTLVMSRKVTCVKGAFFSEGPRKLHKRIRDVDKATHVLHIDIARPYIESREGHHYFLVGALRLPDRPLMLDIRLLKTRTSVEVCAALERMTSFFESLSFEGFEITDSPRIKRLQKQRSSPRCASRSSCPITAASITPSPPGMTYRQKEQQKDLRGS